MITFAVGTFLSCGSETPNTTFDSILDLFEQYDVVHLGERHWNMTDYDFRVAFVNYPRFAEVVDDIVIESGNYLYQDILDHYVLELEDMPKSELQKVWRNTVVTSGVWDATIYKDFIHAVREVNEGLPPAKRIRLIAAEPPIDWSKVNSADQWMSYLSQRSTHTPGVVKAEVIDKGRKALIIYGAVHFFKSGGSTDACARNIRSYLEEHARGRVFSILPLSGDDVLSREIQDSVASDDLPQFIDLRTSAFSDLLWEMSLETGPRTLGDIVDAILYFGPGPDLEAEYDPEAARDSTYQAECERRRTIESAWR